MKKSKIRLANEKAIIRIMEESGIHHEIDQNQLTLFEAFAYVFLFLLIGAGVGLVALLWKEVLFG